MSDITQQIKEKLDIVEVLRGYIQLSPAGKNFKALCPFHREKTPSFMVTPERQRWHCFGGCNEGGDVISFVMKYENLEFYDALRQLAERAGIDISKAQYAPGEYKKYQVLYDINAAAKDFFKQNLIAEARAYYIERGLQSGTIEEFELGFAPANPDGLFRALIQRGFSVQDIERAGVIVRTERGTYWDRFRGRLIFPLYNNTGKVIGFTGRISASGASDIQKLAKYINSPETPIFSKSKMLYGFHKTKNAIRDANTVVVVEGQMDFLMTYQSGVKNVVASSGTALTTEHVKPLRRLAEKVLLCFDNDEAGQRAVERSIDLALAHDFTIGVVALPEKDPADLVRHDSSGMRRLVDEARPVRAFYFERYLPRIAVPHSVAAGDGNSGAGHALERLTTEGLSYKNAVRALLTKIKTIASPLEQSEWLRELAQRIGSSEHTLALEMERLIPIIPKSGTGGVPTGNGGAGDSIIKSQLVSRKDSIAQRIVQLGGASELQELAPEYLSGMIDNETTLRAAWENARMPEEDDIKKEIAELVRQLRIECGRERLAALKLVIARAQHEGNETVLAATLQEFDIVSRKLHTSVDGKTPRHNTEAPYQTPHSGDGTGQA